MAHQILVADDDPHIIDVIGFALSKAGMVPTLARNGREALDFFRKNAPDLIILDIGMPEMDGLEVCRQIRKTSDVPILFLSARDEEIDRVLGLEIGGDDYVTKPFSPRELTARVNAILRRGVSRAAAPVVETELKHGALVIHEAAHLTTFAHQPLLLTAIEFSILCALVRRPTIVFSREQILDAAYPDNLHVSDRTIDSHIRNIRAKLSKLGCESSIDTVHGVGFRMGSCEAKR